MKFDYDSREHKYGKEFVKQQQKFYNSKLWKKTRDYIRDKYQMKCCHCNKFITGRAEVDHIIEITPDNIHDDMVTLDESNLELLCASCHGYKTNARKTNFMIERRDDINLF